MSKITEPTVRVSDSVNLFLTNFWSAKISFPGLIIMGSKLIGFRVGLGFRVFRQFFLMEPLKVAIKHRKL